MPRRSPAIAEKRRVYGHATECSGDEKPGLSKQNKPASFLYGGRNNYNVKEG